MKYQILVDGLSLTDGDLGTPTGKHEPMAGQLGFWLVQAAKRCAGFRVPRNLAAITVSFESSEK